MTAISFLLLSSGLAMCGWRFNTASTGTIRRLLSAIFFLSASYNAILGVSSLFSLESTAISFIAHLALTALALVSVYALYYIFAPDDSPRLPLIAIGMVSSIGLLSPSVSTFCLLTVSLLATLYIFIQLFRKTEARNIKILSLAFSVLTFASIGHALIQLIASAQQTALLPFNAVEITLGLIGAGVLIWSITTPALRGAVAIFVVLMGWWVVLFIKTGGDPPQATTEPWQDVYNLMGVWGIWFGFKATQRWGGFKTALGKAAAFFTLGLLMQVFGQISFSAYINFLNVDIPYPSLADIAYFGSIILYVIAIIQLGKAFGVNYDLKRLRGKNLGLLLFGALFSIYFLTFGLDYAFNWRHPISIILDFAYPLGDALFVTLSALVLFTHTNNIGARMKKTALLILGALFMQYAADAFFSYKVTQGTYTNGTASELIYLSAYFLMAIAIIQLASKPASVRVAQEEVSLEKNIYIPRVPSSPKKNYGLIGAITIFTILLGWWATFYFGSMDPTFNNTNIYVSGWFDVYCVLAVWGVWCGFKMARKYGGFKNAVGKIISLFTLGLLCQVFGQITFGIYNNILNVAIPYPSLADVTYLTSPVIYLLALIQLGKTMGINYNLKLIRGKLLSVGFFIALFGFYWIALFQQGYTFDWQQPIRIVLDLAYPFIETLFLAVGILIYRSYKKENASITKRHILYILAALSAQFVADAFFSFLLISNKWVDSSFGDLPYFVAYFLMTIAIIRLSTEPIQTHPTITAPIDRNPVSSPSKTRIATGIMTNVYSEMLNLFETIRDGTKKQSLRTKLKTTIRPRTFP